VVGLILPLALILVLIGLWAGSTGFGRFPLFLAASVAVLMIHPAWRLARGPIWFK